MHCAQLYAFLRVMTAAGVEPIAPLMELLESQFDTSSIVYMARGAARSKKRKER